MACWWCKRTFVALHIGTYMGGCTDTKFWVPNFHGCNFSSILMSCRGISSLLESSQQCSVQSAFLCHLHPVKSRQFYTNGRFFQLGLLIQRCASVTNNCYTNQLGWLCSLCKHCLVALKYLNTIYIQIQLFPRKKVAGYCHNRTQFSPLMIKLYWIMFAFQFTICTKVNSHRQKYHYTIFRLPL